MVTHLVALAGGDLVFLKNYSLYNPTNVSDSFFPMVGEGQISFVIPLKMTE